MITDGHTNIGIKPKEPADALRAAPLNAIVFALGIGPNVNTEELLDIAGSSNNVFTVESFKELKKIIYYLGCKYVCIQESKFTCLFWGENSSKLLLFCC